MNCTSHCCAIDENFNHQVAAQQLEQYRRKGASPSTRALLHAIREAGVAGATVLDVGGGVGAIALELLGAGASRGTMIEASAAYIAAAREEADRRQMSGRLDLVHGDVVSLAAQMPAADVVTLDKVVCCYPEMERILDASTSRSARLYGIVYPRDAWWARLAVGAENALRRVRRNAFRVYVFRNAAIDDAVRRAGFSLRRRKRDFMWVIALYERTAARS